MLMTARGALRCRRRLWPIPQIPPPPPPGRSSHTAASEASRQPCVGGRPRRCVADACADVVCARHLSLFRRRSRKRSDGDRCGAAGGRHAAGAGALRGACGARATCVSCLTAVLTATARRSARAGGRAGAAVAQLGARGPGHRRDGKVPVRRVRWRQGRPDDPQGVFPGAARGARPGGIGRCGAQPARSHCCALAGHVAAVRAHVSSSGSSRPIRRTS